MENRQFALARFVLPHAQSSDAALAGEAVRCLREYKADATVVLAGYADTRSLTNDALAHVRLLASANGDC